MKFGFIGAGAVAQTIARRILPFGHEVLLSNSRGPDTLADVVGKLGRGASAGTPQQAAEQDVVVLSVAWSRVPEALASVPDWSGRTLVDATNRINPENPSDLGDLSGPTSSEIVADQAVGAKVIKAFNSIPMQWIDDASPEKPRTVLFVSGDDAGAKNTLITVLEQVGFAAVDLGTLAIGGRQQQVGGPLAGLNLTLIDRFVL
ncbi:NADPH-dependent F420 reductase [Jiella pacifica]|uniref:NAD(P)-binding domain-containing protein n=1 Tax=Jiella pacifica TaxID=2696469 RepID=A0A6N9T5N2_9HYPH|nr:NAD(P)-binding domain-containing protein [Jiella pacifica]NDW05099.1 NAD(P)-binding domain-containing protein [Jiella pacifica]